MNNSLLWFDNSEARGLTAKIARGATWFLTDRSVVPSVCYVHPTMISEIDRGKTLELPLKVLIGDKSIDFTLLIKTTNTVLPNHFWYGIE